MKKLHIVLLVSISIIVIISGFAFFKTTKVGNEKAVDYKNAIYNVDELEVKLYYYNPALDQGPGGQQCTKNGLVSELRAIPKTATPLTDTIKLLLSEKLSDADRALGIESEFPLAGVTLKNASIQNGVATLTFDDPQNKTGGGSCSLAIRWAQIEATAKQFETVKSVRFLPETLFQP
jgi:hypothetical protein